MTARKPSQKKIFDTFGEKLPHVKMTVWIAEQDFRYLQYLAINKECDPQDIIRAVITISCMNGRGELSLYNTTHLLKRILNKPETLQHDLPNWSFKPAKKVIRKRYRPILDDQ